MRTIWKFPIARGEDGSIIEVPVSAKFAFVGIGPDSGSVAVWVDLHTDSPRVERRLRVYGTGWSIASGATYIGSAIDGPFVWHLFEDPIHEA